MRNRFYADHLHDAIERYLEAERAMDALETSQDTPEEAAWLEIIQEITDNGYEATTAPGAMAALRLSKVELNDIGAGSMAKALVFGAMAYFEKIEGVIGQDAFLDGIRLMDDLPTTASITGAGYAAIYDGLSLCIQTLDAIMCQPRCEEQGRGGTRLSQAGEYLQAIEQYLTHERRRVMTAASKSLPADRSDGSHAHLEAVLQFSIDEADLSFRQKVEILAQVKAMEATNA